MHATSKPASLSRQSTPKKKIPSGFLTSLASEIQQEKRCTEKLEARINSLERSTSNFITRSVTPLSSKLKEPQATLDLSKVSKGNVSFNYPLKSTIKADTDRKETLPSRVSPTPYRLSPSIEHSDLAYNQRNIEHLRTELQQRREMIVGLKETVSRKQLEHKYWALVSEIEETSSRIFELKRFNDDLSKELSFIQSDY